MAIVCLLCNGIFLQEGNMKKTKTVQAYKNTAKETNRSTLKTDKSGFSDPIKIEDQNPNDQPKNGFKTPWDFTCPQYDQRSGNFVNAGTHYGVGYRSPEVTQA